MYDKIYSHRKAHSTVSFNKPETMKARYDGHCYECNRPIFEGQAIVKRNGRWAHNTCGVKKSAAASLADRERHRCERCDALLHYQNFWRGLCSDCRSELKNVVHWTESLVVHWLDVDRLFVERALLALYERQTRDEQARYDTVHKNYIGFNAADAGPLTRSAKWLLKGNHLDGRFLEEARKRLKKYRRQLVNIIDNKQAEKAEERFEKVLSVLTGER